MQESCRKNTLFCEIRRLIQTLFEYKFRFVVLGIAYDKFQESDYTFQIWSFELDKPQRPISRGGQWYDTEQFYVVTVIRLCRLISNNLIINQLKYYFKRKFNWL